MSSNKATLESLHELASKAFEAEGHVRIRSTHFEGSRMSQMIMLMAGSDRVKIINASYGFQTMELAVPTPVPLGEDRLELKIVIAPALARAEILLLSFAEQQKDTFATLALQEIITHGTLLGQELTPGLRVISLVTRSEKHDQLAIGETLTL